MFDARQLRPMLATLAEAPLEDASLVYEPKYDGIRAIVLLEPGPAPRVRFWSRNGNEKTDQFPEVARALEHWASTMHERLVLDGEIVALDADMRPAGFQRLQHRIHVRAPGYSSSKAQLSPDDQPTAFFAFDILGAGDEDLRPCPLIERRTRLEALFAAHPSTTTHLRISEMAVANGRDLYKRAAANGWEGLIVKHARSPYRAGRRSPEWRKLKITNQDEFVIGGWTEPKGTRTRFGALVLGAYDPPAGGRTRPAGTRRLRYVGDVGTGFSGRELDRLWSLLEPLGTAEPPFEPPPKTAGTVHWVQPSLVAQVRYAEWTDEGRLRHPVYLGLRDDKAASEVTPPQGTTVTTDRSGPRTRPSATARRTAGARATTQPRRASRSATKGAAALTSWQATADAVVTRLDDLEARRKDGRIDLPDGDTLDVTNLQKVFWPDSGTTKGDLLRHYMRIAPLILPVIDDRPLVMKRLPNGVDGQAFYQHRAPEPVPTGVRIETLPEDDVPARLVGGSLKTLLYMAQLASISMDPWFSTVSDLDHADQVAIDLDPQPGATFDRILDVARWVHDELDSLDVTGYPKTSGSGGLHIFIPLPAGTPYEAGMLFCQIVATMVSAKHPKVATVERAVRKRKAGSIYVDYLQNIRGKTLACAYSARASRFAGVSTPLTWAEVDESPRPEDFTLTTIAARVAAVGDLWEGTRAKRRADLMGALERLRSR